MSKKNIVMICIIVALAVVLAVVLTLYLTSGAANGSATPTATPSLSPSATATATATDASAGPTAEPIVHITASTMTTGLDGNGAPVDSVMQYGTTDTFIANCTLNTTDEDPVTFVWYKGNDEFDRDESTSGGGYVNCELQSQHSWDPGDYSVDVYLQDITDPDASLSFTVVASAQPSATASASQ